MTHSVLMGDPAHFSVVGGANPHTRDRWGQRKSVDHTLAIQQWNRMRETLEELGLRVIVVPPDPAHPGLVYPANAGFRIANEFVLSHLTPTRADELPAYETAVSALGLRTHRVDARFEGEADLFPAGEFYLFTHGTISKPHFVPRLGWPPWKRVYGFRSDPAVLAEIDAIHPLDRIVQRVELIDERYYHGDTCLCSFGSGRAHLMVYASVIHPSALSVLEKSFGDRLVGLGEDDAAIYAANSFAFERDGEPHLVMPHGISSRLSDEIRDHGVQVITVDVSEFYKKGGGSVKCMIGDLGEIS